MKNCIILLICSVFILNPVFAEITDDFVLETLDNNLKIKDYTPIIITDDFAENNKIKTKYTANIKRDYSNNNEQKVYLRIKKNLSTRKNLEEGAPVTFILLSGTSINNKLYPKGTNISARIENVVKPARCGVPAYLTVGNFYLDKYPLYGEIHKVGNNKTIMVKSLMILFSAVAGAGIGFMFIKGGHAKIRTTEIFQLTVSSNL